LVASKFISKNLSHLQASGLRLACVAFSLRRAGRAKSLLEPLGVNQNEVREAHTSQRTREDRVKERRPLGPTRCYPLRGGLKTMTFRENVGYGMSRPGERPRNKRIELIRPNSIATAPL
jgi:hypothetical protein